MFTWSLRMIKTEVRKAIDTLSAGGVILYPTDTIWGLGCDATNPTAVRRIYEIKQRSDSKSMLVLMPGVEMLGSFMDVVPAKALEVISTAATPTTIVYPGVRNMASNLLAEDGSVGIRITSDPFCKELTELFGKPIVSTSANISGTASPGFYGEIDPAIISQVAHVVGLRQDETSPASASTILKLDKQGGLTIIRL